MKLRINPIVTEDLKNIKMFNYIIDASETPELLKDLNKGIDNMENNCVTSQEDTMKILIQRYNDYVLQN